MNQDKPTSKKKQRCNDDFRNLNECQTNQCVNKRKKEKSYHSLLTSELRPLSRLGRSLPLDGSDEYGLPASLMSWRDPLLLILIGGRLTFSLDSSPLRSGPKGEACPCSAVFESRLITAVRFEAELSPCVAMSSSFLLD